MDSVYVIPYTVVVKPLKFLGDSQERLRKLPTKPRRDLGYNLNRVQHGIEPADWRPMPDVGSGVIELRERDAFGIYRVFYVAKFADAVYVLHTFTKKTQKTPKADIRIGRARYAEAERQSKEQR